MRANVALEIRIARLVTKSVWNPIIFTLAPLDLMLFHDASIFFGLFMRRLDDGEESFESPDQPMNRLVVLPYTTGEIARNVAVAFSSYQPSPDVSPRSDVMFK
jgi:hypothetical protein